MGHQSVYFVLYVVITHKIFVYVSKIVELQLIYCIYFIPVPM